MNHKLLTPAALVLGMAIGAVLMNWYKRCPDTAPLTEAILMRTIERDALQAELDASLGRIDTVLIQGHTDTITVRVQRTVPLSRATGLDSIRATLLRDPS